MKNGKLEPNDSDTLQNIYNKQKCGKTKVVDA